MRLTSFQRKTICALFYRFFFLGDSLWLFGSRADDTKRGGDIDLYIETHCADHAIILDKKLHFLVALQQALGEQKIDIVINRLPLNKMLPIYEEARKTGVLLMIKRVPLVTHIALVNKHVKRLRCAIERTRILVPLLPGFLSQEDQTKLDVFDVLTTQYNKIQDRIGSRIFSLVVETVSLKDADEFTAIDKLNMLEKWGYLTDANWWHELRTLRNETTHDYTEDDEEIADVIRQALQASEELLAYWEDVLQPKLLVLAKQTEENEKQTLQSPTSSRNTP